MKKLIGYVDVTGSALSDGVSEVVLDSRTLNIQKVPDACCTSAKQRITHNDYHPANRWSRMAKSWLST